MKFIQLQKWKKQFLTNAAAVLKAKQKSEKSTSTIGNDCLDIK